MTDETRLNSVAQIIEKGMDTLLLPHVSESWTRLFSTGTARKIMEFLEVEKTVSDWDDLHTFPAGTWVFTGSSAYMRTGAGDYTDTYGDHLQKRELPVTIIKVGGQN